MTDALVRVVARLLDSRSRSLRCLPDKEILMAQNKFNNMPLDTLLGAAKAVAADYQSKPELNLEHTGDMIEALTIWIDYYTKVTDR